MTVQFLGNKVLVDSTKVNVRGIVENPQLYAVSVCGGQRTTCPSVWLQSAAMPSYRSDKNHVIYW